MTEVPCVVVAGTVCKDTKVLDEAYLEIDGKTYKYPEMIKNFDKIESIIENEKTKLALEKLS